MNSTTLEVAIGMALIYLILSLFCTAINEAIAGVLGSRAKNLEKGIQNLFTHGIKSMAKDDGGVKAPAITLAQAVYGHGLVQSLYRSGPAQAPVPWYCKLGTRLPSYIPRVPSRVLFLTSFSATRLPGSTVSSRVLSLAALPALFC